MPGGNLISAGVLQVTVYFKSVDYVIQHGLGGVSIWTIDMDDFHGICGQGHYPLMHVVNNAMRGLIG
ncbi:hypothetical protein BaRGS_00026739 [Batillaria attramentaria]|uniref:GH18 domain-containing protein n=1 Tax=Batillaria attramentaria TaxID=370345 RepID=A0ABD0K3P6_9CAEN